MNLGTDAYISKRLTHISLDYSNADYIESMVAPAVNVTQQSGKILSYDSSHMRIRNDVKSPGANSLGVVTTVSDSDLYYLEKHKQHEYVPVEDILNADDPLQPKIDATMHLVERLRLGKEYALGSTLTDNSNYTNTSALTGDDRWDDPTSNPIEQVNDILSTVAKASTKWPNSMVVGYEVMLKLLTHPNVMAYFPGAPKITQGMLQNSVRDIFGIDNLYVGKALYDSSNDGATADFDLVWGKNVIVFYNDQRPTLRSRTFSMTFQRSAPRRVQDMPPTTDSNLADREAHMITCVDEYDQVLVDEKCGYLFTTVIS